MDNKEFDIDDQVQFKLNGKTIKGQVMARHYENDEVTFYRVKTGKVRRWVLAKRVEGAKRIPEATL